MVNGVPGSEEGYSLQLIKPLHYDCLPMHREETTVDDKNPA